MENSKAQVPVVAKGQLEVTNKNQASITKTNNGLHKGWYKQDRTDFLPPDNIEWMVPEYQALSPIPSVSEIGLDDGTAPMYLTDPVDSEVAVTAKPVSKMTTTKKVAIGAGLVGLFLLMKD